MTNTSKLKGRIAEKGFNLSSLSATVRISRPSLRAKITGRTDFKASEIEKICCTLEIPHNEIDTYFFTAEVPVMETQATRP